MSEYKMRRIPFIDNNRVNIPEGSLGIKIEWDADRSGWVLLFVEPTSRPVPRLES